MPLHSDTFPVWDENTTIHCRRSGPVWGGAYKGGHFVFDKSTRVFFFFGIPCCTLAAPRKSTSSLSRQLPGRLAQPLLIKLRGFPPHGEANQVCSKICSQPTCICTTVSIASYVVELCLQIVPKMLSCYAMRTGCLARVYIW